MKLQNCNLISEMYCMGCQAVLKGKAKLELGHTFNPLPNEKILDWSKLEQTADDILKCI